jgi:hypothetical protein
MDKLTELMKNEISKFKSAHTAGDHQASFHHLSRAHILSQSSPSSHLFIHWLMFRYAIGRKDYKEISGQALRLIVTLPGHLLGRVPVGNIGWATVGLTEHLPLPEDLKEVMNKHAR